MSHAGSTPSEPIGPIESALERGRLDLQRLADELVASGEDIGLQISVAVKGRTLIDICAGLADVGNSIPVDAKTLFPFFSVTKLLLAGSVLSSLAEGRFSLDTRICEVWPEFGQFGKQSATVKQALTHSVGIPQMPDGVGLAEFCDWERMTAAIASLRPLWKPGAQVGYHAYTFGWILGEFLRRALDTKEDVGSLVDRLISKPALAERIWIGLPAAEHRHVAVLYREAIAPAAGESLAGRAIPDHLGTRQDVYGRAEVRSALLPAAGGIGNAASLARICAALTPGDSAHGATIAAADCLKDVRRHLVEEPDLVTGRVQARALGFYVGGVSAEQGAPFHVGSSCFGHPGSGGSLAWSDPEIGAGFAIMRNRLTPQGWETPSVQRIVASIRNSVRPVLETAIFATTFRKQ